jgi:hypothetical protein
MLSLRGLRLLPHDLVIPGLGTPLAGIPFPLSRRDFRCALQLGSAAVTLSLFRLA